MKSALPFLTAFLVLVIASHVHSTHVPTKEADFTDPNTGYLYRVISYNVTPMNADGTHRSLIKVSRVKIDLATRQRQGEPENVQTIPFHPSLVDFDLDCVPTHCYLVVVTSMTKRNVELFSWQRVQFDRQATRDSFARAHAVQLFRIQSSFYIAVAQEQLHLSSVKLSQEYEDSPRFIGCAVFKFSRGQEHKLRYHQFIKLRFTPYHVNYFPALNPNNITLLSTARPSENHHLIFSLEPNWQLAPNGVESFIWSPLNDYFWPHRMPRNVTVTPRPGLKFPIIKFPTEMPRLNWTQGQYPTEQADPAELCFHQLQRLLAEREINARKLIESGNSLWRSPHLTHDNNFNPMQTTKPAKINARVIVHGDVIVKGSMIESPQISLIGGINKPPVVQVQHLTETVDVHSPAIVESRLRQARYRLNYIRDKLSRAVPSRTPLGNLRFDSQIKFFKSVSAKKVIFEQSGVSNSDVRLNGIPFRQLERELVSLQGAQDIAAKVTFTGNVVADLLEIHGHINDAYMLRDAIDITSRKVQIIETGMPAPTSNGVAPTLQFDSISVPELILTRNATINDIALGDFITRDTRDQIVIGRKSFKRLSMAQLDLANPHVLLNNYNISHLINSAIRINNSPNMRQQTLNGNSLFTHPVRVNNLYINSLINGRINITSLIVDSVKANEPTAVQTISGHKHFFQSLKIAKLKTDGSINGVLINQVFNLNPYPPVYDFERFISPSMFYNQPPVTGSFIFHGTVTINANMNAQLINNVDISRRAIRRIPIGADNFGNQSIPQIVSGHKIFLRPLRILDKVRLRDVQTSDSSSRYPLINGIDLKLISTGIRRQRSSPAPIYIENLDVDGNFHIETHLNGLPRATLGNFSHCPLNLLRSKVVLAGQQEQLVEVPIRVNSLRARSVFLEPGALNHFTFPEDFVLRSRPNTQFGPSAEDPVEFVFGHKSIDRLVVTPPFIDNVRPSNPFNRTIITAPGILFGPHSSINNLSYNEIQTFVAHERQQNSTGETVIQNLNVYGNIHAKRINEYYWPEDILLKSVSGSGGPVPSPYLHRRIYSPLIFTNTSSLEIENQLVLRGPIQLGGRMNGVNLTQLAHQSVTYGDKDLFSAGRPVKNKIFLGGLTVVGDTRSLGLIDGINFEEMRRRVVTVGPMGKTQFIAAPKQFLSDVSFLGNLNALYLGDLPLDLYLKRINFSPNSDFLQVYNKKSITGALRINKQLIVHGLINGIDFVELKAKAISLSPQVEQLTFNKTLTVDGDVYVDNLLIDEKNGTIDGVRLTNLLPVQTVGMNELIVSAPSLTRQNTTHGSIVKVAGSVQDCEITCSLASREQHIAGHVRSQDNQQLVNNFDKQMQLQLRSPPLQQMVTYPPRPIYYQGKNLTYMRTTPPYASQPGPYYPRPLNNPPIFVNPQTIAQNLALRRPTGIIFERSQPIRKHFTHNVSHLVVEQIETLRKHIVSLNLIKLSLYNDLVVGFVDSLSNDISNLRLADEELPDEYHVPTMKNFLLLDQIDYMFRLTATYHLSVGVETDVIGQNVTSVYTSIGGGHVHLLSTLPVESPNSAMFLKTNQDVLFLLVSQDYVAHQSRQRMHQCPVIMAPHTTGIVDYNQPQLIVHPVIEGVHVYLFHSLQNSSSLTSAYFDLYQTIDLPAIDSFEKFSYRESTYVVALSRSTNKIYLLLLRGYSGFQVVSHINMPMVEKVKIIYTEDEKPTLLIYQTDGLHRLMDSVMI